jgi:hypothetical protein
MKRTYRNTVNVFEQYWDVFETDSDNPDELWEAEREGEEYPTLKCSTMSDLNDAIALFEEAMHPGRTVDMMFVQQKNADKYKEEA